MNLGINFAALKNIKFWLAFLITNLAIASASGVILPETQAAQIVGWIVAVLGTLGYRAWVPAVTAESTEK